MNNKGFGLVATLIIIFTALLMLVVSSIALNRLMYEDKKETGNDSKIPSIEKTEEADKVEEYEKNDNGEESLTKIEKQYKTIETKLLNTAKSYISTNNLEGNDLVIKGSELIEKKYMNNLIDPNNQKKECSGYVIIKNNEYIPYINCSGNYKTENYNSKYE